jgi:perosamine synthetase
MNFFYSHISPKSIELVVQVLKSGFISEGKMVKTFEQELESVLGLTNPVALNSGTSALHLALVLAGVGPEDEVILPAQTFASTGTTILQQKARPVFADIQYNTGNITPDSIKEKITGKTKAIIPVHWAGYPCDLDEINILAKEHNCIVIEDAAHALGAFYKGRPVGAISRFTAFSFQAIKHLTTGDGGALCCLDDKDYLNARKLRWIGIDRDKSKPSILGEREYDIKQFGYKYHMNDLAAAVGLGNLEDLRDNLKRRREIAAFYRKELKDIPGLQLLDYRNDRQSAYWLFTVLVENRLDFIKKLKEKGIPTSVVHLRIDKNSVFTRQNLPNQEKFDKKQISIPIHPDLSDKDISLIVNTIKKGW